MIVDGVTSLLSPQQNTVSPTGRMNSLDPSAFVSNYSFGNTMKRTSEMLEIRPSDIKRWNQMIISEIKSLLIKRGIKIKNITNLIGELHINETGTIHRDDQE